MRIGQHDPQPVPTDPAKIVHLGWTVSYGNNHTRIAHELKAEVIFVGLSFENISRHKTSYFAHV
jgi:alanine dehydrogenase